MRETEKDVNARVENCGDATLVHNRFFLTVPHWMSGVEVESQVVLVASVDLLGCSRQTSRIGIGTVVIDMRYENPLT